MISICYLDVDGVVADLQGALARLHGVPVATWPPGVDDLETILRKPLREVWAPTRDMTFWARLPLLPWAHELVDLAHELFETVCFLTQPTRGPDSLAGKRLWIEAHFPDVPWLMGPRKDLVAGPGRLLVDDRDPVERAWTALGGTCVLVPARWNRRHAEAEVPFRCVAADLARIVE